MDTVRERIIKEFMDRAAVIRFVESPWGGWNTDIGSNVYRARLLRGPSDCPCIVVWPEPEEAKYTNGMMHHTMPVRIEGLSLIQPDAASTVAEKVLGDLIQCFTDPEWVSGQSLFESAVYKNGGTDNYPEEGQLFVGAYARFDVTYWTVKGNPYVNKR